MKASRLIFTLLLASSVAVVQLAAQQTKADQRPIEEVKAKAEAGDAESEVELGVRYEQGKGVAKDQAEAVKWFRKAAEQNYAKAQYNLAHCFDTGEGVAKDPVEAVKWYRKAAEQNYATAQENLGVCYVSGEGVAEDLVEAYKWLLLAVRQGNEHAKEGVTLLEHALRPEQIAQGQKRARDFKQKPIEEVKAKAEAGDAESQVEFALRYDKGEGVAKDQVEAVKWYRKAAEQNYAKAQFNLGVCYDEGAG